MKTYYYAFLLLLLLACETHEEKPSKNRIAFQKDMQALQEHFHIPGMAVLVKQGADIVYENYSGVVNRQQKTPVDSSTIFPIASVSKIFAATLMMQLVEEGKLDLEQTASHYLPDYQLDHAIKLKHLLSHTSQGRPGQGFLYSSRYGMLTAIIQQVTEKSYSEVLEERVFSKIGLQHTYGLENEQVVDQLKTRLASPYQPTGEVGNYDPGLSTSSGIAATARDLALFDNALQDHQLMKDGWEKMTTPFETDKGNFLPYGLGIFSQQFMRQPLHWGYGQNDCFSSLFLKVPKENLTLIILANNSLLSDPARLIYGDISYSLFALTFLEHWVLNYDNLPVGLGQFSELAFAEKFRNLTEDSEKAFYLQKLKATALAGSLLGHLDKTEFERSKKMLQVYQRLERFAPAQRGDLSLLHAYSSLAGQGIPDFDQRIEALANQLALQFPENPYPKVYLGFHYDRQNRADEAAKAFQAIVDLAQTSPNWYTIEALNFLGNYYQNQDPVKAKKYYQQIVDIGWNYDGMLSKAKETLQELGASSSD